MRIVAHITMKFVHRGPLTSQRLFRLLFVAGPLPEQMIAHLDDAYRLHHVPDGVSKLWFDISHLICDTKRMTYVLTMSQRHTTG